MTVIPDAFVGVDLIGHPVIQAGRKGHILRALTNKGNKALAELSYKLLGRYYYISEDRGGEPIFIAEEDQTAAYWVLEPHKLSAGSFTPEAGLRAGGQQ